MNTEKRSITIRGTGKESFAPDLIVVSMTVETTDKSYSDTTKLQAEKIAEVTEALVKAGFDKKELTTSQYNINTSYDSYQEGRSWKKIFKGYHCVQGLNLRFEQSSERLKQVINALSSCTSSVPQFNIAFTVKDKDKVSDRLLALAVKDAFRKAKVLAEAANSELGELLHISYNPLEINVYSETRMMSEERLCKAAAFDCAETEINPEEIEASVGVEVVWEIK